MQKLKILNSREKKPLLARIKEQWGCDFKTDLVWMMSAKNRIYLMTKDMENIDFKKVRIDTMGSYFATINDTEIRISIEGSQSIGPIAKKNVVELSEEEATSWMEGNDIMKKTDCEGYIIIRSGNDFLGCGKATEDKILNFVPKNRRINRSH